MPLVRFEVRNEYSLGQPQLYKETNREDPKAVLDGVAVAGLVGILRQLGDLAEFAGEVFHGLQEQVMSTASRSHKLLVRVQNIEAALPSLEKAVLAQTSHIHFAYTAGSEWRARIQNGQNHFIYNDLPRFIMDSYEECRDPPRLNLLDKFDTGGPGSCLKRYSDPTFFRRASGNFSEPDAEKVPKEKKARKNKKKKSSQRNVDFLHSASMPNQSGRMEFTTPIVNGRTSSHTTSTSDIAVKSDVGYRSSSFDSRTGSGYVESTFHINSPVQPEERESKEFSSSFMHHNNVVDSVLSNEQPSTATDDFPQNSSPEQNAAPGSSCDTWDEKAEIVLPKGLNCDGSEVPEMVITDSDLGIQDDITNVENPDQRDLEFDFENMHKSSTGRCIQDDVTNVENPDHMDLEFDFENMHKSSTGIPDCDEVESETDNFMDALNTIESESENDLDFQTKHELEQFSANVDDEQVEDEISTGTELVSDDHPSRHELHILPEISVDSKMACDLPDMPSEIFVHEHNSPISEEVSISDNLPGIQSSTNPYDFDGSKIESLNSQPSSAGFTVIGSSTTLDAPASAKVESIINEPSSSGLGILNVEDHNSISSSFKYDNSQAELSSVYPVSFWTNGGLLGLEPSKPPDFSVSKTASQDPLARSTVEAPGPPNDTYVRSYNGEGGRPGCVESIPSSCYEGEDAEVDKFGDFQHSNRVSDVNGGLSKTSVEKPMPLDVDVEAASVESSWENDENASQMFGLSHRLLINGFRRKMSLVPNGKTEEARRSALEQSGIAHQVTPEKVFNETFGLKSSFDSLTSSPPLDHMKISFHPIDGFEASKLNLKFPDGNHSNGIVRDMFPSFQLVPEAGISVQDAGSDSDDDTFCRSSPYISDDCLSHRSDSDSEQWESGESPENKDHELYDALCRKTSESVSHSQQAGEMTNGGILHVNSALKSIYTENGADPSLSSSLLDLPSFDSVNPAIQGKSQNYFDQENLMDFQCPKESKPSPPLPPPVQWQVTKSTSYVEEDKQNTISETQKRAADPNHPGSTVCQQPKPATAYYQQVNEEAIAFRLKGKDQWKLNVQKEANLPTNDKGVDEKDDFLNQIRTKSFTLRRTVTAKANFSSGPSANNKVTAILEKANAIRQAVGSDDGEDEDSWSDT
ncbi:protein SCAR3 isoform X2 [Euphorbia lathyris]|uniref:protein SCAR3 isoform X2 n=1 Tax=Euphorbia lathyris TaxID=212925 RepID=UPI00331404F3